MRRPDTLSAADLAECRAILRLGSRSFSAAALLLPARVRAPATALYAFCRLADDAIDHDPAGDAHARLTERLELIFRGTPKPVAADRAMAALVARHAIPRALPEALLEGFSWDAAGRTYATIEELHDYAARVAGTVGIMMAILMGVRDAPRLARAGDLGSAMQLSNIARDVGEDARNGRIYLPLSWLTEAGIRPEDLLARPAFSPALGAVVARLLREADQLYARADAGIGALPRDCRAAIGAARRIYAEIGCKLERNGLDSIARRTVVGAPRKATLIGRAMARSWWPRRGIDAPPLPANAFLIEAVLATPAPAVPPPHGLDGRVAWLVDLFTRLERQPEARRFRA